jgi:phenylpropionate dioxygenase-like ring-hydroxylating dioxygenase large terminal subunit
MSSVGVLRLTDEPRLRRYWYPIAGVDAAADKPIARTLLGVDLVLWRPESGSVRAALDRCPHRDARLSRGWIDGCALVCPYHGWEYGSSGRATRIPQLEADEAHLPPRAALDMVTVVERYGWVWACLAPEPIAPIPEIVEYGAPGWRVVPEPESEWDCAAPLLLENNLDPGHIAFVHRSSFGSPEVPLVPIADVEHTVTGLWTRYEIPVQSRPGETGATVRRTTTDVYGPLLAVIRIDYPDGLSHIMIKSCAPVDDCHTRQLQIVLRNDTEGDRPAADIIAFDANVWEEDKAVLEHCAAGFRLDLRANVHTRTDRPSVEYRRMLARMVAAVPAP